MNMFEIWLDESGDFNDSNKSESPSLMGGVILKNQKYTKEQATWILDGNDELHSTEMDTAAFNELLKHAIDRLNELKIKPLVLENKERLKVLDRRRTYLAVFAEGILKVINDLYLIEDKPKITLHIARWMNNVDGVLVQEYEDEYVMRLREHITLLKITNRDFNNIDVENINIVIGSARNDPRLMVSDLICHAWFRKKRKLQQNVLEKFEEYCVGNVYSMLESPWEVSIRNKTGVGLIGEGLYEWIGYCVETKDAGEHTADMKAQLNKLKDALVFKLEQTNRSECILQLNILTSHLKSLVNYDKEFSLAEKYLDVFFESLIPELKQRGINTVRVEAEAQFSWLTAAEHMGNVLLAERKMQQMNELLHDLSSRWENLDFIFEYYVRKGAYLNSIFAYPQSVDLMTKLLDSVEGIMEISSEVLSDDFISGAEKSKSVLLGKIYGVRSQAYMLMGAAGAGSEIFSAAQNDCIAAMKQFESEGDISRQYQTLAQIETLRESFEKSEGYLSQSVLVHEGMTTEEIIKGINGQKKQLQAYSWMHFLSNLSVSFSKGDADEASFKFRKVRKEISLEVFRDNLYPNNVIHEKYAVCQLYLGERSSAATNFSKAIEISFRNEKDILMQLAGIRIIANMFCALRDKGGLSKEDFKIHLRRVDKCLRGILQMPGLPESILSKAQRIESFMGEKEYKTFDFIGFKEFTKDIL